MPRDTHDNPATFCRQHGWAAGQHLVGDEGHGPTVIRITAIGERGILARQITHNGEPVQHSHENSWTLTYRDWQPCNPPP